MAREFNKVVLMGNLARDPEVRYTVEKRAWARFTVAVGYTWKNKNEEYQDASEAAKQSRVLLRLSQKFLCRSYTE